MKKNYFSLISMRIFKKVIDIFTDSFLVLYFLQLSNNNIVPLGIYNIIQFTVTFLTIFVLRRFLKNKHRINLLRTGVFLNLLFFLLLFFLKEKIISYTWLIGIVYGLEEGFYYSVFNIYESSIKSDELAKYSGTYSAINSIVSVLVPLLFGSVMSFSGFGNCTMIVLVLVIIKLILSFIFQDEEVPEGTTTNIKNFITKIKEDKLLLDNYICNFAQGLTYGGAFSAIITIYIIREFKTGFSLGVITSILSILTSIASFIFAHFISKKKYKSILVSCNLLTILSLILMVIKCNIITIILFNFVQTFARTYVSLIDWNNCLIVSKKYQNLKEEFFVVNEVFIYIGRLLSYTTFCLLAFTTTTLQTNLIMLVFILFLLTRLYSGVRLQKNIETT